MLAESQDGRHDVVFRHGPARTFTSSHPGMRGITRSATSPTPPSGTGRSPRASGRQPTVTGTAYDAVPSPAALTGMTRTMSFPGGSPVSVSGLDVPVTVWRVSVRM